MYDFALLVARTYDPRYDNEQCSSLSYLFPAAPVHTLHQITLCSSSLSPRASSLSRSDGAPPLIPSPHVDFILLFQTDRTPFADRRTELKHVHLG